MYRKLEAKLLSLDTELEITLRNLGKVKRAKSTTMADLRARMQPISKQIETKRP